MLYKTVALIVLKPLDSFLTHVIIADCEDVRSVAINTVLLAPSDSVAQEILGCWKSQYL